MAFFIIDPRNRVVRLDIFSIYLCISLHNITYKLITFRRKASFDKYCYRYYNVVSLYVSLCTSEVRHHVLLLSNIRQILSIAEFIIGRWCTNLSHSIVNCHAWTIATVLAEIPDTTASVYPL